jgi:transketolase N-terminal domain/subunit
MQEGPIWEAVMFAGQKHLDNLCVMVDRNNGQLDMANRMIFPMPDLEAVFRSFNWEVHSVDATQYNGVYARSSSSGSGRATASRRRSSVTGPKGTVRSPTF